jgi:hypothetical protein
MVGPFQHCRAENDPREIIQDIPLDSKANHTRAQRHNLLPIWECDSKNEKTSFVVSSCGRIFCKFGLPKCSPIVEWRDNEKGSL